MNKYLIINTGSSSKKYSLYENKNETIFVHFENENGGYVVSFIKDGIKEKIGISAKEYDKSLDYLLDLLIKKTLITSKDDFHGIGIRIVAPGLYFNQNHLIDDEFIRNLKKAEEKAPLHIEAISEEINKLKKFFGKKMLMCGVSDSVFHKDMPNRARFYSIPLSDSQKFEIYRYGYHGLSFQSIVDKLKCKNCLSQKMIVCHIGGGISITAIKDGKSLDTSMGFTPLEGMTMSTRVGDIDSGAVIYLSEVLGIKGKKLKQYLNKSCGLLGLSGGISDDVRDLLKIENKNVNAKNALDIYTYKIQKQIGAYIAVLGGIDLLVFSGTVGERSFKIRQKICDGLEVFGIELDKSKNEMIDRVDIVISTPNSKVKIEVVKTNETKIIAEETARLIP